MENPEEEYKTIIDSINEMYTADQKARSDNFLYSIDIDRNLDIENTNRAKEIIKEIGYPTISKVGKDTSYHFWILVQHADHDKEFQKYCLGMMKDLPKEEVQQVNIAYLEDRVRVGEGRPLLYGTQYRIDKDTGEMVILPIEDAENVDERRAEVGLPTLEEYLRMAKEKREEVKEGGEKSTSVS